MHKVWPLSTMMRENMFEANCTRGTGKYPPPQTSNHSHDDSTENMKRHFRACAVSRQYHILLHATRPSFTTPDTVVNKRHFPLHIRNLFFVTLKVYKSKNDIFFPIAKSQQRGAGIRCKNTRLSDSWKQSHQTEIAARVTHEISRKLFQTVYGWRNGLTLPQFTLTLCMKHKWFMPLKGKVLYYAVARGTSTRACTRSSKVPTSRMWLSSETTFSYHG